MLKDIGIVLIAMVNRSADLDFMTPQILQELLKLIEEDNVKKFYKQKPWRTFRKLALRRDRNTCQDCFRKGNTVHHKKKVKEFPHLALRLSNVSTTCYSCHNKEHPEKLAPYNERPFVNEERW